MIELTDDQKQELEQIKQKCLTKKGKFSKRKFNKVRQILQNTIFNILDSNEEFQKELWNTIIPIDKFADIKDLKLGDNNTFVIK